MFEPIRQLWPIPKNLDVNGKIFYKKAGEYLVKEQILTNIDKSLFEVLCLDYQILLQFKMELSEHLPTPKERSGDENETALISSYRSFCAQFEELSEEFFLTPEIRARLKIDPNLSLMENEK